MKKTPEQSSSLSENMQQFLQRVAIATVLAMPIIPITAEKAHTMEPIAEWSDTELRKGLKALNKYFTLQEEARIGYEIKRWLTPDGQWTPEAQFEQGKKLTDKEINSKKRLMKYMADRGELRLFEDSRGAISIVPSTRVMIYERLNEKGALETPESSLGGAVVRRTKKDNPFEMKRAGDETLDFMASINTSAQQQKEVKKPKPFTTADLPSWVKAGGGKINKQGNHYVLDLAYDFANKKPFLLDSKAVNPANKNKPSHFTDIDINFNKAAKQLVIELENNFADKAKIVVAVKRMGMENEYHLVSLIVNGKEQVSKPIQLKDR